MTNTEGWELDAARFERKTLVVMLKDFLKEPFPRMPGCP